jgi:hypothetical protein
VETENPSACATVNCNWCKKEIALIFLNFSVIERGCVTQLLINPIMRNGTRLISDKHVTICNHGMRSEFGMYIKVKWEDTNK